MKFRQMISGAVCMVVAVSSMSVLESVVADAVNLENPVTVNATATSENSLYYVVYKDDMIYKDHVEITGYDESAGDEIIIPETIEGLPVTKIAYSAFINCSNLKSVTIPNSVTEICDWAFLGCSSLKSITIPKSVTKIGWWAFAQCKSLKSITIQNADCEIDNWSDTLSNTATIYGYPDSTAQAYAKKNNLKFVALDENQETTAPTGSEILWGDADENGEIGIQDVVLMNRVYVGVDKLPDGGLANADTDQDGKITLSDSMNVLRLLVHLISQEDFPIQAE